ncbi:MULTISPECIES: hypothetical protein [Thermodesulfovibrio]|jgi:hypothetical protein|uniref:hypothetical protein n=1 Tax=Thermodesulfovibrio TaxID=28261 RepID=UPI002616B558|nr:hypothetical protein [Thermodesulfovibrio sp.]
MKTGIKILLVVVLVLSLAGFIYAEEKMTLKPLRCCIGGTYDGITKDSPNCPYGPKPGKFTMIIHQTDCGSAVYGEVLDIATGAPKTKFEGTVTPIPRSNCCMLTGKAKGVPGTPDAECVHEVKAKICKTTTGKWEVINGTYTATAGKCCSGTFSMKQR